MTSLLLDTHVLLWCLSNDLKLSRKARKILMTKVVIKVSVVSAWEISVKKSLGKLQSPDNLEEAVQLSGFEWLNITVKHTNVLEKLPNYHNDPFDRLLIAQSIYEGLTIMTADGVIPKYDVKSIMI